MILNKLLTDDNEDNEGSTLIAKYHEVVRRVKR